MAENGYKKITAISLVMGILIGLGGAVIAFGMDLGQLRINTSAIQQNTIAIRELERCYASQTARLEALKDQSYRIDKKIDRLLSREFED